MFGKSNLNYSAANIVNSAIDEAEDDYGDVSRSQTQRENATLFPDDYDEQ